LSFINSKIKSKKSTLTLRSKFKVKIKEGKCDNATDKFLCEQDLEKALDNLTNPK